VPTESSPTNMVLATLPKSTFAWTEEGAAALWVVVVYFAFFLSLTFLDSSLWL